MTLADIRALANILMQAQPGVGGMREQATWAAICGSVAADIRKRKLVTDHKFSEEVFLDCALGQGEYALSDPAEDEASWLAWEAHPSGHGWDSRPVLGKDQA